MTKSMDDCISLPRGKHCRSLMSHADKERSKITCPTGSAQSSEGSSLLHSRSDISGSPDQDGKHHLNKDAEMTGKGEVPALAS